MRIMALSGNEVDEPLHTDGEEEVEISEVSMEALGSEVLVLYCTVLE